MDGERDTPKSDVNIPGSERRGKTGARLNGEFAAAEHDGRLVKHNGHTQEPRDAHLAAGHTVHSNGVGENGNGTFLAHVAAGGASGREDRAHSANGSSDVEQTERVRQASGERGNLSERADGFNNGSDESKMHRNDADGGDSETGNDVVEIRTSDNAGEFQPRGHDGGSSGQIPETEEDETLKARGKPNGASGINGSGGGKNGTNGSAAGSNGANGSGGASTMERRTSNADFREILSKGLAVCRRNLVTVGIFSFIVNILVLAIPIYLFNIADRVLSSQSIDTLVMLSIVVAGAILMHVLLDIARRIILLRVAVDMESKLGAPVLSAAARAAQDGSSREFQILGELQNLRAFITGPVILTMFDAPVAPLYLLAIFMIHPHLGFIVCGTVVLLLVIAGLNQRTTAVPFGRANAFAARANLQADAMARNAQAMNAMGMIPEGVNIWGGETAQSLKSQVIAQDRNILLAGTSKFIRLGTQIAVLGWGGYLAILGEVTGGMIIAASIVGSRALQPIEGSIEGWRTFVQARSAYSRIKALLLNSPLNFDRLRLPRPMGHLNVDRVLYVPPPNKKVILNGVSFELQPGESLGIVGASGTGKSTLGKMLVGSVFPTSGSVRLDSMDLRNWDARQFGENVGYLPQDVQLFPASIKDNIARMRKDASDQDIFDAAEMADVHGMISEFAQGYETQVAMDGSPLSGGQKQRIGLARAFFGDPRLVVLDEPNSNLDSPGERALAKALDVAKEKQITVVAITQRPSLLKSVDKIMILKNGTVQALGSRDDLIPLIIKGKRANGSAQPDDDVKLIDAN
ncbi:MAG: type I secretion system permease/ATPase [Hyphomicrobiaceae bacterium]|nr:type I secretion system permease/ATPase [Hyphomicrobiaceae bacterium]